MAHYSSVRSRSLNDLGLLAPRAGASPAAGTGSSPRSYGHGGVCWCASRVLGSDSSGRRARMHSRRRASICARRDTGTLRQVRRAHSQAWPAHKRSIHDDSIVRRACLPPRDRHLPIKRRLPPPLDLAVRRFDRAPFLEHVCAVVPARQLREASARHHVSWRVPSRVASRPHRLSDATVACGACDANAAL